MLPFKTVGTGQGGKATFQDLYVSLGPWVLAGGALGIATEG